MPSLIAAHAAHARSERSTAFPVNKAEDVLSLLKIAMQMQNGLEIAAATPT